MSYLLRLTLLASAVFFLCYVSLSAAIAAMWTVVRSRARIWNAELLYGLRIAPFAFAIAVVGLFVIPSFLYLEPLGTSEVLGTPALGLASGGIAVVATGAASVLLASWRTARFIAACTKTRQLEIADSDTPAIEISGSAAILAVAGVCQPKLLISEQAHRLLEPGEMQAAIQHELAHVVRHDNLKKLAIRFVRFPFLAGLERRWLQAAELAADDAAVDNENAAVNLASALLKVARQSNGARIPDVAMSLVPENECTLRVRVERLLAWKPVETQRRPRASWWTALGLPVLVVVAVCYWPLLRNVHELSELFVR